MMIVRAVWSGLSRSWPQTRPSIQLQSHCQSLSHSCSQSTRGQTDNCQLLLYDDAFSMAVRNAIPDSYAIHLPVPSQPVLSLLWPCSCRDKYLRSSPNWMMMMLMTVAKLNRSSELFLLLHWNETPVLFTTDSLKSHWNQFFTRTIINPHRLMVSLHIYTSPSPALASLFL